MVRTGAEIVIECLKEQGVDVVFGYPGGSILNVYDALYKHSDEIFHVLTSHEQGAAHAAIKRSRGYGADRQKVEFEDLARIAREQDMTLAQVREKIEK